MVVPKTLQRLRSSSHFQQVLKHRQRLSSQGFYLHYYQNHQTASRLGLGVSRKVANAVGRNRIKRLIRESFRNECSCRGMDIVVFAKSTAAAMSNREILDELNKQWQVLSKQLGALVP